MAVQIKVSVKPKQAKPVYPVLARSHSNGQIVLFTAPGTGTVLQVGRLTNTYVGSEEPSFVDVTDKTVWEILPEGTTVEIVQGGFE